jgi:SAM-dependent methyltransferase
MAESAVLSCRFDDAAKLYDKVRPPYPEEIVEHIIPLAALPTQARIFEVGCGTGQRRLPFAKRGYAVVAVEYLKLLWTFSDHRAIPEPNRSRFFEAIGQVIARMGGEVVRDYDTLALLARKT